MERTRTPARRTASTPASGGTTAWSARPRIIYYSHPAFFDVALSMASALGRHADVDLLIEVSPSAWRSAGFDVPPLDLPAGLIDAAPLLDPYFPTGYRKLWGGLAGFRLVSHRSARSLHPASWRVSRRVLRHARTTGADLIHVDDVDVTPRLALGLSGNRIPIVLNVHDPTPHSGEAGWRKGLARRIAFPRVDRFVLHNRALAPEFAGRHGIEGDRVHTVPLGSLTLLREWVPRPLPEREPRTLLFTGRLSPYKGLDVLYAALPEVAARVPGLRVVVAGAPVGGYTPPEPPSLPGRGVVVVDPTYQPSRALAERLARAAVVVCPYRDATQSGVVLAAHAFDTPTVCSDTGGLREYVEDGVTGRLVPPGDPTALASALADLLTDPEAIARMSAAIRGARTGGPASYDRAAAELMDVYARVLAPS